MSCSSGWAKFKLLLEGAALCKGSIEPKYLTRNALGTDGVLLGRQDLLSVPQQRTRNNEHEKQEKNVRMNILMLIAFGSTYLF